jgi:hypothetical protein
MFGFWGWTGEDARLSTGLTWTGEDARLSTRRAGGAVSFGVGNWGYGKAQPSDLETSEQRPVTGDL